MGADERRCPECGGVLGADAPMGVCPACVLKVMMDAGSPTGAYLPSPPGPGGELPNRGELQALFPNLEIQGAIGRGGMGVVYRARQVKLDRLVALKVIRPDAAEREGFAERFAREARAMAKLNHPNIVTVHDFGEVGGLYYLIMELVEGDDLRAELRRGPIAPERAVALSLQIGEALKFAHEQGVVHRDIKPENVLLDPKRGVKLADFGLAKLVQPDSPDPTLTATRHVIGTPHYMAPEQFDRPREVDHRADIYASGVLLYEMLTGDLPLGRYDLPSERLDSVDEGFDAIVETALRRDPARRYPTVAAMQEAIVEAAEANFGEVPGGMGRPSALTATATAEPEPLVPGWIGWPVAGAIAAFALYRGWIGPGKGLSESRRNAAEAASQVASRVDFREVVIVLLGVGLFFALLLPWLKARRAARSASGVGSGIGPAKAVPAPAASGGLGTLISVGLLVLFTLPLVASWLMLFRGGDPDETATIEVFAPSERATMAASDPFGPTETATLVEPPVPPVPPMEIPASADGVASMPAVPLPPAVGPSRPLPPASWHEEAITTVAVFPILLVFVLPALLVLGLVGWLVVRLWRPAAVEFLPPDPAGDEAARRATVGPAVGLMIAAGVDLLSAVLLMGWSLEGNIGQRLGFFLAAIAMILVLGGGVVLGLTILSGAIALRRVERRGLAMASTIVAMLPIAPGALVGLPAGIWALVVLTRPDVEAAFARSRSRRRGGSVANWSGPGTVAPAPTPMPPSPLIPMPMPAAAPGRWPSLGLAAVGALHLVGGSIGLATVVIRYNQDHSAFLERYRSGDVEFPNTASIMARLVPMYGIGLAIAAVITLLGLLVLVGALRRLGGQSRGGLAGASPVLAMILPSPLIPLNLAVGLWALADASGRAAPVESGGSRPTPFPDGSGVRPLPAGWEASRSLRWPAMALVLTGVLHLFTAAGAGAATAHEILFGRSPSVAENLERAPSNPLIWLGAAAAGLSLLAGAVILRGGLAALGMRPEGGARWAAVVSMLLPSPATLVGLPAGLWMLAALSRPEVPGAGAGAAKPDVSDERMSAIAGVSGGWDRLD